MTDAALLAGITEAEYHADQVAEQPSLSASIAKILCTHSPLHAWTAHPRLNPNFATGEEDKFSIGNAAHALLLEGRNAVTVIEANDWRTKEAKELRDQARAEGQIPLLGKHWDDVEQMAAATRAQLDTHQAAPPLFTDGKPEQTIIWEEAGVTCRARLDWLRDDLATYDDLKTTSRSANPEAYSRALFSVGGDIQAAMYIRGIRAVTGADVEFRWCVIETAPPYALSVISPGPDVLALGQAKVEFAINVWRMCLESGVWPGYPTKVCYAELPGYEEARWLEREALMEAA